MKNTKSLQFQPVLVLALLVAASLGAGAAAPPDTVNYQGVLRDSLDRPLNGDRDMVFRFYDDEVAGNEVLVDAHTAADSVPVSVNDGLFSVALGSGDLSDGTGPGTYGTMADLFRDHGEVWLQVTVGGETLTPRVRVRSSAYASNAGSLDGRPASSFIDDSGTAQTKNGYLTVSKLFNMSGSIYMQSTGASSSQSLYFSSGSNPTAESLYWNESYGHFGVTDAFNIGGPLAVRTTGGPLTSHSRFGNSNAEASELANLDDLLVSGHMEVDGALFLENVLYMDDNGFAGDQTIFFAAGNSRDAESLMWNSAEARFELTDDLNVNGQITSTGDLKLNGNDLWFDAGTERLFWDGPQDRFEFTDSVEVQGILDVTSSIRSDATTFYMNYDGPDSDSVLYFYDEGLIYGEYLLWNDSRDRFELTNELAINGPIRAGSIGMGPTSHSVIGNGTASDPKINSLSDLYVTGEIESDGVLVSSGHHSNAGNTLSLEGDIAVRVMFDADDTTTTNLAEWYHDSTYTSANKVMELQEDGDLRIRGLISQNTAFDLAETFLASQPLRAGDLVSLDPGRPGAVRLSAGDGDRTVLGVVSGKPGMLLGSAPFDAGALRQTWGDEVADRYDAEREMLRSVVLQTSHDIRGALDQLQLEESTLLQEYDAAQAVTSLERGGDSGLRAGAVAGTASNAEAVDLDGLETRLSDNRTMRDEAESRLETLCLEQFYTDHFVPVALAGRVPVKVDASAGAIAPGDPLGPGATPGVARRAGVGDPIIGTALEGLASGQGEVLVFVNRGGAIGPAGAGPEEDSAAAHQELAQAIDDRTPDPLSGIQSLPGNLQIVLDGQGDSESRFSVFRDGNEDGDLASEVFRVDENGDVLAAGAFRPDAMDVAEFFPVSGSAEPGDVLVADRENPGTLVRGDNADDPAVVGVVSTAAGVLLGSGVQRVAATNRELADQLEHARRIGDADEEARLTAALEAEFRRTHAAVAMTGTVPCKVDAGYGPIRIGDLLTTSPTPGHAMRSSNPHPGTILGKALQPLDAGTGTIRIVVMLR